MSRHSYHGRHEVAGRRRWPIVLTTVVVLLGAGLTVGQQAARSAVDTLLRTVRGPSCTATTADGEVTLTPDRMGNAATIAAVGLGRDLPPQAVTIALATAMQESQLRNLDHGDRDSLGLFQQRPSAGWGTAEQVRDPVSATGAFYDALGRLGDYTTMPVAQAAQTVQRSAYPEAYAKHASDAAILSQALVGAAPAALRCSLGRGGAGGSAGGSAAAAVRHALEREFGGTRANGSGGDGTVVDVPAGSRGWAIAHWAVARADALGIAEVAFDGRAWTAGSGDWQRATAPRGTVRLTVVD
jgi:hypothetical protein